MGGHKITTTYIPVNDEECCELLKKFKTHSNYHESEINIINFHTGRILSILKEKYKNYVLEMKDVGIAYSKSYCKHLTRFYQLCL